MMRVVMLVNDFPPLPTGGAEKQAERLSAFLASNGNQILVITRHVSALPKRESRLGYEVIRIPQPGPGKLKTISFMILSILKLFQLRGSFDILHAHLAFSPAVVSVIAGKLLKKKVIVKFGNSDKFGDIQHSQRSLKGKIRLGILRKWADRFIALDRTMLNEALMAGFPRSKIVLMKNGVDATWFAPTPDKPQAKRIWGEPNRDSIVLLYTGRLAPQKALDILLQALRQVAMESPSMLLVLLGQGEQKASLVKLAADLGLEKHVLFIDYALDVRPYLNASDIFVLPSRSEGISNSLLEAMASGIPCLATDVGGASLVLGNGEYGVLVPPGDTNELAAAISKLVSSADLRSAYSLSARRRILEEYDFQVVGNEYLRLYQSLMEDTQP